MHIQLNIAQRFGRWPLWCQIALALGGITVLIGVLSAELMSRLEEQQLKRDLNQRSEQTLALLTGASLDALISRDVPLLETMIEQSLKNDPNMSSITIENAEGQLLAERQNPHKGAPGSGLSFARDAVLEGEHFGRIVIEWRTDELRARIREQVSRNRNMTVGILLFLTLFIIAVTHWLVTRPIARIHGRLNDLAEGDRTKDLVIPNYIAKELLGLGQAVQSLDDALAAERQRRAELHESEARLKDIAAATMDWLWETDERLRLTYLSDRRKGAGAIETQGLTGKSLSDLGQAEPNSEIWRRHMADIEARRPFRDFRYTQVLPDGGTRFFSMSGAPVFDEDGRFRGYRGASSDITSEVEAKEAAETSERQLRQAQKLKAIGQLASGIAHEINTPAQYIGDNLRFLEDAHSDLFEVLRAHRKLAAAAQEAIQADTLGSVLGAVKAAEEAADLDYLLEEIPTSTTQSLDGIQQVSHIVQAMKDFAHSSDKMKAPVDLNKTIENTLTISRNSWKFVAEVETELDPELPPVACVGAEVKQVLLNLVVNAAHAIEARGAEAAGRITIASGLAGGYAEIRVSDSGTGIPEAVRDQIFDPFFTTKEIGKGTGQGLPISHDIIVNRHQGRLFFETEEGQGTTFVAQLPLEQTTTAVQAAE